MTVSNEHTQVSTDGSVDVQEATVGISGRATYEVVVITSDVMSAGTNADVTLQLFGENGKETERASLCPDKKQR